MKTIILTMAVALIYSSGFSQRYFTRTGNVRFYSDAPMEKIEATNNQASSILDISTGEIAFSLQMRGFKFEKALMEEHFNENYVESHKYPKASFKGSIKDFNPADLKEGKKIPVVVTGELTIHGVTKPVTANGFMTMNKAGLTLDSEFQIALKDYDIEIPGAVIGKIAEEVKIYVSGELSEYNN